SGSATRQSFDIVCGSPVPVIPKNRDFGGEIENYPISGMLQSISESYSTSRHQYQFPTLL
ncbi:MAG TPA: hypothetical protein VKZ70_05015, partial [Burkholderiaceae bacterium]|nr:hypothetical protein [Burkholderiaceae bacterium]